MRAHITVLFMMLTLVGTAIDVSAHDEFRIIGTLEKHQDSTIVVKKTAGNTVSIKLDKQTSITQDKKKVEVAALKVGQSLVVDAYGDYEEGSLAIEIRIVPPIRGGGR